MALLTEAQKCARAIFEICEATDEITTNSLSSISANRPSLKNVFDAQIKDSLEILIDNATDLLSGCMAADSELEIARDNLRRVPLLDAFEASGQLLRALRDNLDIRGI